MSNIARYTPFARYALIILATKMVSGGFLPDTMVNILATDPVLVEFIAGLLLYGGTGIWYYWSAAKKALDEKVG